MKEEREKSDQQTNTSLLNGITAIGAKEYNITTNTNAVTGKRKKQIINTLTV